MDLKDLSEQWNDFGKIDPLWSIMTWPEKKGGKWKREDFFQTGVREVETTLSFLKGLSVDLQNGKALDFGCGVGRLTQALCKNFSEVHGVDIAASMIDLANGFNDFPNRCFYHLNKEENLNLFAADSFDFIYSRLTFQHMEPRYAKGYIREFLRVIKPGGVVVFQEPSRLTVYGAEANHRETKGMKAKIKLLIPAQLMNLFRKWRAKITQAPIMEIYGIEKKEMTNFLLEKGAKIINISEFGDSGPEWVSYRYCMTK